MVWRGGPQVSSSREPKTMGFNTSDPHIDELRQTFDNDYCLVDGK